MSYDNMCINCFKDTGGEDVCMNCGFIQSEGNISDYSLPARTVLNKYVVGKEIGIKDNCILYKGYDTNLRRTVLIKEFFPVNSGKIARADDKLTVLCDEQYSQFFETQLNGFIASAQIIRRCSNDSAVSYYFDEFKENGTAYQVVEYIDGLNLEEYFCQVNSLTFEEALDIMMPVMEALSILHKEKIYCRTLSPSNIYITVGGDVKLSDLSVVNGNENITASENPAEFAESGYSAPEIYRGETTDEQTDIYSLGAIWCRLLYGFKPDDALSRKNKDLLKKLSVSDDGIPEFVKESVIKALSLNKNERFKTVDDFIKGINGGFNTSKKRGSKLPVIVSVAVAVAIGIAGISVMLIARNKSIIPTKSASIELWYPDYGNEKQNARWENIEKDYKEFVSDGSLVNKTEIEVKCTSVPADKYEEKLEKAFKEGDAPDIYFSGELLKNENAYNFETLYKSIEKENDSDLNSAYRSMKSLCKSENKISLDYDIPILYVSTYRDSEVPKKINLSDMLGYYSEKRDIKHPFVCSPTMILYASYIFGGDGDKMKLAEDMFDYSRTYIENKNWKSSDVIEESTKFFLGSVADYTDFYTNQYGRYKMLPLAGEGISPVYIFNDIFSVNKNSTEEEIKAAVYLLYFIVGTKEGQTDITSVDGDIYSLPFLYSCKDSVAILDGENKDILDTAYSVISSENEKYCEFLKKANNIVRVAKNAEKTYNDFKAFTDKFLKN